MTIRQLLEDIQAQVAADPTIADMPAVIRYERHGAAEITGCLGGYPEGHTPFVTHDEGRTLNGEGECELAAVLFTCATDD